MWILCVQQRRNGEHEKILLFKFSNDRRIVIAWYIFQSIFSQMSSVGLTTRNKNPTDTEKQEEKKQSKWGIIDCHYNSIQIDFLLGFAIASILLYVKCWKLKRAAEWMSQMQYNSHVNENGVDALSSLSHALFHSQFLFVDSFRRQFHCSKESKITIFFLVRICRRSKRSRKQKLHCTKIQCEMNKEWKKFVVKRETATRIETKRNAQSINQSNGKEFPIVEKSF